MKVAFKGTNIKLSPLIRANLNRKIVRVVERFLIKESDLVKLALEVEKTTRHHRHGKIFRAEANLSIGRVLLRAEAVGEDLQEAIDLLEEKLEREIKKFKFRRRAMLLKGAREVKRR